MNQDKRLSSDTRWLVHANVVSPMFSTIHRAFVSECVSVTHAKQIDRLKRAHSVSVPNLKELRGRS